MNIKLIILLIFITQLINTFCSRQVLPAPSSPITEKNIEKKQLKDPEENRNEAIINIKIPKSNKISYETKGNSLPRKDLKETSYATADDIIKTAQKYLGVPHCMKGANMKCIDCSGLLVNVFGEYGIQLPHNSEEQSRYGKLISKRDDLKKGDLVFFIRSYKTNRFITHSGIYIGNNKFIHASSRKGVTITSLNDSWWTEKFIFGTRILD